MLAIGWFGFIATITQPSSRAFLEGRHIVGSAARAVAISYGLVSNIFGKRLVSPRSVGISLAFSVAFFLLAFFLAAITTDGLWDMTTNYLTIAKDYPVTVSEYAFASDCTTISLITAGLFAEFLYIVKSRLILRTLRLDTSYFALASKILLDVATTTLMFVMLTPLIIMIGVGVLGYNSAGVDLTDILVAPPQGHVRDSSKMITYAVVNLYDTANAYLALSRVLCEEIFRHMMEKFSTYHFLEIYPRVYLDGIDSYPAAKGLKGHYQFRAGVVLPLTTMLATALGTTIWVMLTAGGLILIRLFCHTFSFGQRSLHFCQKNQQAVMWWGITGCIVWTVFKAVRHWI